MYLTTAEIAEILEDVENLSPKRLSEVIIDMAERITYLERCYFDLSIKYDQLKRTTQKLHLNSMYGLMVTESKGEHNQ